MDPHGQDVATATDSLSSVTLLGLALVGAVLTVGAYWLLGG